VTQYQQQAADNPDDKGKPFTPGSTDDPNCLAGCYDPKVLNDIGVQPQFADGTLAPPPAPSPPVNPGESAQLTDRQELDALKTLEHNQLTMGKQSLQEAYGNSLGKDEIVPDLGKDFGLIATFGGCYGGCAAWTVSLGSSSGLTLFALDPSQSVGRGKIGPLGFSDLTTIQVTNNAQGVAGGPSVNGYGFSVNGDGIAIPLIPAVGTSYTVNRQVWNIKP